MAKPSGIAVPLTHWSDNAAQRPLFQKGSTCGGCSWGYSSYLPAREESFRPQRVSLLLATVELKTELDCKQQSHKDIETENEKMSSHHLDGRYDRTKPD